LNTQGKFRIWHLNHHLKPPRKITVRGGFDKFVEELFDAAIKLEDPLPFRRTDVGCIETLAEYFRIHIPNMVRSCGQEYLDGKIGDRVRLKMNIGRVYFKWEGLKSFCQRALHLQQVELDALTKFITKVGGHQGEKEGRDWFRCSYWVPWDIFDEAMRSGWLQEEEGR
jgi:hypothetical protein